MISVIRSIAIFTVFALLTSCADEENILHVGTATNMQFAMEELISEFERSTGIRTEMIAGSSGKLSAQIERGHVIDVFVSADMQYPVSLYRNGHGVEKPVIYAYGELVIISHGDREPSFETMLSENTSQVAIGNPKTAPYGMKAMTVLRNAGILDSVRGKLVYGDNVSAVNHFVEAGAAEIGITARSLVDDSEDEQTRWSAIDGELYTPIAQGMLIVKREGLNETAAKRFIEFMLSVTAQKELETFGYKLPQSE